MQPLVCHSYAPRSPALVWLFCRRKRGLSSDAEGAKYFAKGNPLFGIEVKNSAAIRADDLIMCDEMARHFAELLAAISARNGNFDDPGKLAVNHRGVLNSNWANFWANMPHGFAAEFVLGQTAVSTECNGEAPQKEQTPMATLQSIERDDLVERLRNLLSAAERNGDCAANLRRALERFTALECRRQSRRALADASGNRDQIIARLALLAEIDELLELPGAETVFAETATLFDEIGESAARAAEALRHAGSLRQSRDRYREVEKPPLAA